MPVFMLNPNEISFPYPELAREDGLLAVGGDLSPQRLLLAYENGIFPWYNPGEEILWWCPKERFIIRPDKIHVSRSMKKFCKKHAISVQLNRDFADTMHRCRVQREHKEGTWITDEMEAAYLKLHKMGYAVSEEVYLDGQLAGGLYGVIMGHCFIGESMFTLIENGSKIALIVCCRLLAEDGFTMVDCQLRTDHLESMGGEYISYQEYKNLM